jgi:hypothetical protein
MFTWPLTARHDEATVQVPTTLPPQAVTLAEHVAGGPLEVDVLPVLLTAVELEPVDADDPLELLPLVPVLDPVEPPSDPGLPEKDPQAMTTTKPPARAIRARTTVTEIFIGELLKDFTLAVTRRGAPQPSFAGACRSRRPRGRYGYRGGLFFREGIPSSAVAAEGYSRHEKNDGVSIPPQQTAPCPSRSRVQKNDRFTRRSTLLAYQMLPAGCAYGPFGPRRGVYRLGARSS